MVPSRNDALIFGEIGYIFPLNVFTLPTWLLIWYTNTPTGFAISTILIVAMLVTAIMMMRSTVRASLNAVEFITMRIMFSVYAGWVTAATLIQVIYVLKSCFGLFKDPTGAEQTYTIVNIWIAFIWYNVAQVWERNPVYASVLIWVLYAVKANVATKVGLDSLYSNLEVLSILHSVCVGLFAGFLVFQKFTGKRFANWDHGLLY